MAHIIYQVSGKDARGVSKRRKFPDSPDGREAARAFASNLRSARTVYVVRARVGGRTTSKSLPLRRLADDYITKVAHDQMTGFSVDPAGGRLALEDLAKQWLASDPGKRPSTVGRDRSAFDAQIVPVIGKRRIDSIRQADVQSLVNDWDTRLAAKTVIRTYGALRAAMAYAVSAELIPRSPCRDIRLPQPRPSKRPALSVEDVSKIAEAMDSRYRPMVWIAALLGLRWGEVAGLRVSHVDVKGRTLTVSEIVARDDHGKSIIGPPKSLAGLRTLSIPTVLAKTVKDHLASVGLTTKDTDQLMFAAPDGGPWSYTNFRRRMWLPAVAEAGLSEATFHGLRKVAASALVLGNVDLKTAQTRLGHSDPRLTLAVYAQATTESDKAAADTVGKQFASVIVPRARDKRGTNSHRPRVGRIAHAS